MVKIHGVVLEGERAGRKAELCRGIHVVDEVGNCLGYIGFESIGEIELRLDPRISVTMEAGGLDLTRHLSEFKVGHYYPPEKPTTENNLEVIARHREELDAQGVKVDQPRLPGEGVRAYPFATRSR